MNTSQIGQNGYLERVVVTAADGRVYDLGNPNSRLFRVRVWLYQRKRNRRG